MNENIATRFVNEQGSPLGDGLGLLPIPLYKGMQITIHGQQRSFTVVDWSYHHGHPDEGAGLTVILK